MANEEVTPASTRKKKSPSSAVKPKIESLGVELGTDTALPFSTPFRPVENGTKKNVDEELQELLRDESEEWGPTVRQLVTMRRMDGQARALYRLLTLPIRAALSTATFVPAEDGEAEADFISSVFHTPPESGGMTVTFHRFMSQMLQGMFDGFATFEKVFWQPDFGPLKGKLTLKKLAHRPAETVSFIVDKTGGFAGLRQRAFTNGRVSDVFIPREYAFYYAAQEEERKFYGVSFFQSAFYHYDKKVKTYYIAHLTAQRAAVGTRVGTVPAGATKAAKAEFANALANLALAQWMMMPEGFKVESLKEAGSFEFLNWVNHHNSQMSKSILAAFFDKEQGAGAGEGSLVNFAAPGDDMFILMLRAVMDDIAAQINHYIIPQLIDFNFTGGKYPVFTWGKLTDEQKQAIATTFDKLANQQTLTPEFIRALEEHQAEEFGLEIDYDEVELREQEEAEAQASMGVDAEGNPLPGAEMDPATGMPFEGGEPIDPMAPPAPEGGLPAPEGGAPAPEAGAPAPAGAAPAAAPEEGAAGSELGLEGDWDLEDFLSAVAQVGPDGEAPVDADPDEEELDEFERRLSLTFEGSGLISLAHEMLDMASEDLYRA